MKKIVSGKPQIGPAIESVWARTKIQPSIGIVLGSGMGAFGERLTLSACIRYRDIPGFPVPAVPGHSGQLLIGHLKERPIAVLQGRCHLYEGYTAAQVTFPVQVLARLGIRALIVTSAAGAINEKLAPGELVLIRDHLNLMGDNPLRGLKSRERSIFVEMTSAYDPDLIRMVLRMSQEMGIPCHSGVLAAVLGPSYETPSEVAMLRALGVDVVCMSTVPEVIMGRYLGLRILGISLITNKAAGLMGVSGHPEGLGHGQVLERVQESIDQMSDLLEHVVEAI